MERPTALVIDASIAVKWFIPESDSSDALSIRNAHRNQVISLFAPDLLTYELANALRYRSSMTISDLKGAIESLFDLDLALIGPTAKSVSRATSLARTLDLTTYDATYLMLAQELDCQVVTSDKPFHDKVQALQVNKSKRIVLLKDYSTETKEMKETTV